MARHKGPAQLEERHRTMQFDDLTAEQKTKALKCKTPEEVLALAKEEGYELSEAQLQAISGGWDPLGDCPEAGQGW